MEFNVTMDATPRPLINPNAPLFASVLGSAADLGGGECVFRTTDGETHVMTHQVLQALDQCRRFLSLDEHVQTVRQAIPSAPAEGVSRVLESLVARRLMIAESDFVADLQARAVPVQSVPMSLLIRLGADHQLNEQLLKSLEAHPGWAEHAAQICVLSTSSAASDAALGDALKSLSKAIGKRLNITEQSAVLQRILRLAGKDAALHKAVEFLLPDGKSTNNSRSLNAALALCAGRRSVLMDAHRPWPLRRHPEFETGINMRSAGLPEARFFPSRDAALAAGIESSALFEEHARVCGAGVGSLTLPGSSTSWRIGSLRGLALSECVDGIGDLKVLTTTVGQRGSSDLLSRDDWYLLDAKSRGAFAADRDTYLRQLQTPSVWVGSRRATLSHAEQAMPFSVDARDMLPCALPFGDEADAGFHALLRRVRPDAVSLRMPQSTGCTDTRKSEYSPGAAYTPDFNRFVVDFLDRHAGDLHAADPGLRLQGLAARLNDLAAAQPSQLMAFTSEYLQFVRSERISRLQFAAQEAGEQAPVHWLADLRAHVTSNGRALIESSVPRLRGDPEADEAQAAAALAQRLQQTAQSLQAWSAIWPRLQDDGVSSIAWGG